MPSCWFSLQFACINKQLFCFKFPKHNHGLDCPGAACSSSQNCCQSCFGRNKQLSSKWYMAVNSSGYKRNLTHWNQHWWKQMRCWRSHCWHGYWFFLDCCDHTGSLCCTCADPTAREVCQGKMRQADHFIYSTWASSQHAPASHFISKWTLVLLLFLVSQVVSINFKKIVCVCGRWDIHLSISIRFCWPSCPKYAFIFMTRSYAGMTCEVRKKNRCLNDACLNDVCTFFARSAASPMNGWERIPHTVERTQSCSVRGTQTFQEVHVSFLRIRGEQCPEDRGFPHWVLDDPQVGRGDSCRCVCGSLCGFSARGPRRRFRWQSFFSRHHDANWGRGRGRQRLNLNTWTKWSVCVHVCVLRSRCAATFPMSSAWIGAHVAQRSFRVCLPPYVSDCGLLMRILAVSPINLRARRHCLRAGGGGHLPPAAPHSRRRGFWPPGPEKGTIPKNACCALLCFHKNMTDSLRLQWWKADFNFSSWQER